jgi:SAM-dependent methyltransferase
LRDTDRDWCEIADSFPYFGVLSHERFKNPTLEDLREFFLSGEYDVAHYLETSRRVFGPFEPKSALDFGCGVGRILIPLAKLTGNATGVDIADGMLRLARRHAAEAGFQVTLAKTIPADRTFEWVVSHIVLQHIPPVRGYPIIRELWRAVAPDGLLFLQLTVFRDSGQVGEFFRGASLLSYDGASADIYSKTEDQTARIIMYDYELSRVFACMPMADGCRIYLEKSIHGGHHGFRIYVRKQP